MILPRVPVLLHPRLCRTHVSSRPLEARRELPADKPGAADNRARLQTAWLWEPVPLPEKRTGPALLVVHAGEELPRLPVALEALDLREAEPDLVAGYAMIRRYLFDYRVDLETPLSLLIDAEGRMRKIYAEVPDVETARADLGSVDGRLAGPRGLPFDGFYIGQPSRDYYKFGGALLQGGYPEQALPYFEEGLRRSPDNPKALLAVGHIHLEAKRLKEARQVLERASVLNPGLPEVWNDLGGVEAEAGDYAAALRYYEKALALGPDLLYALVNAARARNELGDTGEAERLYRRALVADPENADTANQFGLLLAKAGRLEEGKELFQKAIQAQRDHAGAINNLGVLYMRAGQPNDAIAALEYGIQTVPDSEQLYMNLARVYVALRQPEKAREVLERLVDRRPSSEVARRALEALSSQ